LRALARADRIAYWLLLFVERRGRRDWVPVAWMPLFYGLMAYGVYSWIDLLSAVLK
jgi:hypothetical protein